MLPIVLLATKGTDIVFRNNLSDRGRRTGKVVGGRDRRLPLFSINNEPGNKVKSRDATS